MKKISKLMVAALILVAAVMSLCACGGLDMSKASGTYTLSTINGKSVADYANEKELPESAFDGYKAIVTEKTFEVQYGSSDIEKYDIEVRSDGFECMENKEISFSVKVDLDKSTLSYKLTDGSETIEYVYKK